MARTVHTVTGPIHADELGVILPHEHVMYGYPGYQGDLSFDSFDKEDFLSRFTAYVSELKSKYGLTTILDATTNECARDVELLRECSERAGVNIICCTGYYCEEDSSHIYHKMRSLFFDIETEIYDLFKKEIYEGIRKTGIKAGVIKVASSTGKITDMENVFFRAATRLAKEDKDIRVITHTTAGTCALEQANFFLDAGVDPKQVIIGHFCCVPDIAVQKKILEKGFFCGFDRFGLQGFVGCPTDEVRFEALTALLEAGYEDQILISADYLFHILGRPFDFPPPAVQALSTWSWAQIFERVLPTLESMGVTQAQLNKFMSENAKAFFC